MRERAVAESTVEGRKSGGTSPRYAVTSQAAFILTYKGGKFKRGWLLLNVY